MFARDAFVRAFFGVPAGEAEAGEEEADGARSLSLRLMLPRVTEAEPGVYCVGGRGG